MSRGHPPGRGHVLFPRASRWLLLALVTLAPPFEAGRPFHIHEAATAGLYNEEHVLAALESLTGDAPLPDGPPALWVPLVVATSVLAAGARSGAPVVRLADPRAPPLA